MFKLALRYARYALPALATIGFGLWQLPHIPHALSALATIGIWLLR